MCHIARYTADSAVLSDIFALAFFHTFRPRVCYSPAPHHIILYECVLLYDVVASYFPFFLFLATSKQKIRMHIYRGGKVECLLLYWWLCAARTRIQLKNVFTSMHYVQIQMTKIWTRILYSFFLSWRRQCLWCTTRNFFFSSFASQSSLSLYPYFTLND